MWIFTSNAFVSIVEDRNDKSRLLVRARDKDAIKAIFPNADSKHTLYSDYPYRAYVDRVEVAETMKRNVMGIDYDNFKNSIPASNHIFHNACMKVWSVMRKMQDIFVEEYGKKSSESSIFLPHKNPLLIETACGSRRLFAELFPYKNGGILFFDIYWCCNDSGHPLHVIEGDITEERGGWRIGKDFVRELNDSLEDIRNWAEWNRWKRDSTQEPELIKMLSSRERLYQLAREEGGIV